MFCPTCSKDIPSTSTFCLFCGNQIKLPELRRPGDSYGSPKGSPQGPSPVGDFDRTNVMPKYGSDRSSSPPPPPAGNKFDLTMAGFSPVADADDDIDSYLKSGSPAPQQYAAVSQPAPQYSPAPAASYAPAPVMPRTARKGPALWMWLVGGGLLALLFLVVIGGAWAYFVLWGQSFTLKVMGAPRGSKVLVDDVSVGVDQADGTILARGFRADERREVRVTHAGYADWRTDVKGGRGEIVELHVKMMPLTEEPKTPTEDQITKDLDAYGRARIYGINFDSDSDRLKDESKPTLDGIVAMLKKRTDWKLLIEGHTDSTSTPEHNKDLSERRAVAMKNYLLAGGIDASRLTTVGYGASRPVATNDTAAGRAVNRRVELVKQ